MDNCVYLSISFKRNEMMYSGTITFSIMKDHYQTNTNQTYTDDGERETDR